MVSPFLPFLLIIALISSCIELEISAPSFPKIMNYFLVSESMVGATVTYNLVGFALSALLCGPLSEYYGRRLTMIVGNAIMSAGAIGCVIAPTIEWLLIARFIQGLGAATSAVIVFTIIADVYAVDKATKLYGIMNAIFSSLMAISPIVGSFINSLIGWRGNYAFVASFCMISWLLIFSYLPETKKKLEEFSTWKIFDSYISLFISPAFLMLSTIPSLLSGCYVLFISLSPFLYLKTFSLNEFHYTLHQATVILMFSLTSAFSDKIISRLGKRFSIYASLFFCVLGSVLLLASASPMSITISMSIFCMGFALLYPIFFARSLEVFSKIKGSASSASMALRCVINSLVVFIAGQFYDGQPKTLAIQIFCTTLIILLVSLYVLKRRFVNNF
jgi:DHA1 family bicyclomycin/chloramphenicol resistance-like MFS transporter